MRHLPLVLDEVPRQCSREMIQYCVLLPLNSKCQVLLCVSCLLQKTFNRISLDKPFSLFNLRCSIRPLFPQLPLYPLQLPRDIFQFLRRLCNLSLDQAGRNRRNRLLRVFDPVVNVIYLYCHEILSVIGLFGPRHPAAIHFN